MRFDNMRHDNIRTEYYSNTKRITKFEDLEFLMKLNIFSGNKYSLLKKDKTFNKKVFDRCDGLFFVGFKKTYCAPPLSFEKYFRLKGLSKIYKFPFDLKPIDVEAILWLSDVTLRWGIDNETLRKDFLKLMELIFDLNPILNKLKVKSFSKLYDIGLGVTSCFNVDDIKFFIENWNYQKREDYPIHQHKILLIEKLMGYLSWVPCEKTLDKILKQKNLDYTEYPIDKLRMMPWKEYNANDIIL